METKNLPVSANLTVIQKTTHFYTLTFLVDDIAEDITGFVIYFVVKEKYSDTDEEAKIKIKVTDHTDAANGETLITVTDTHTNLTPGTYYYEISYVDKSSHAQVLFYGKFQVMKNLLNTRY